MIRRPYVVRSIAVLAFALLLGLALILWTGLEQRRTAAAAAQQRVLDVARVVVAYQGRLDRLAESVPRPTLLAGTTVVIVDPQGRIVARLGERIPEPGASVRHVPIVREALTRSAGTTAAECFDGRRCLHAFLPLAGGLHGAVVVSIPSDVALREADHALRRNLAGLGVVAIVSLVGWLGIMASVLRKLRAVERAAARIAAGDLSVRIRASATGGEFGVLAGTFDDMATALERRTHRLQTLIDIHRAISTSLDLDKILATIARSTSDVTGAPAVRFWLVDEESRTVILRAFAGPEDIHEEYPRPLPFGEGGVGWVALHGRVLDVPDIFAPDSPILYRTWHEKNGFTACHLVPVFFAGTLVAVLSLIGRAPIRLDPDTGAFLDVLMSQAAAVIHNARLHHLTDVRRRAAEVLVDLNHRLAQAPDVAEVAGVIAESFRLLLDARRAAFFRQDPDSHDLTLLASSPESGFPLGPTLPRGTAAAGLAVERQEAIVTTDALSDPRITMAAETRTLLEATPWRSVAALPCLLGTRAIGVLVAATARGHVFEPERLRLGEALANQAALVLENARLLRETVSTGKRYRLLVERNQTGLYRIRPDGLILECNDAFARLVGAVSREEVIGRDVHVFYPNPEDRLPILEDLSKGASVQARPLRLRRLDGVLVSVLASVAMVEDENGRPVLEGNLVDVTDREQRHLSQIAHLDRVAGMGQLAASIAHELNQPLTAILSNAQAARRLLAAAPPDLAEVGACLDDIISDDQRAAEVIRRMRQLLKRADVVSMPLAINDVVGGTIGLVVNDALRQGVVIDFTPAPALPAPHGDAIQIQQVILNVLANAITAAASGPSTVRKVNVWTTATEKGEVEIGVHDSGPGVSPSVRDRIFDPFFTTKDDGFGMGLAISRTIVEAHGGRLLCENDPAGGAVFRVHLRADQPATT